MVFPQISLLKFSKIFAPSYKKSSMKFLLKNVNSLIKAY